MVKQDADGSKTSEGLHRIKTREIVVELKLSAELVGPSPDEKDHTGIEHDLI